ncbi:hypothetical protein L1049_010205 [Liquidambar formosana]|uniref:Uncharacterized protein n=1 Tax=Liquidambar formosana TaxID=63359 RepID=A0AAP0N9E5_LIQFO
MESAICFRYSPPTSLHLHLPSTRDITRATRPHIGFRHPSLFLSNGSMHCPLGLALHPITRKIDGLSRTKTYKKGNNNSTRGTTRAGLIVFGGRYALKSLWDVCVFLATKDPPNVACRRPSKPSEEEDSDDASPLRRMPDPPEVKMDAMCLMKSGKSDEALELLKQEYEDCDKNGPDAYRVEMALVEILICQGKYEEASRRRCLQEGIAYTSDGRVPLYKAIIYTMLNQLEEAETWWGKYKEVIGGGEDIEIC